MEKQTNYRLHIEIQHDFSANRCIKYNKYIIEDYERYPGIPHWQCKKDNSVIVFTGKGYIRWYYAEGHYNMIPVLYLVNCDGTLITPPTIVENNT